MDQVVRREGIVKRDVYDLYAWAAFKLTHHTTRHLIHAKNITAHVVKGAPRSLVRYQANGLAWREVEHAEKLSIPYREMLYWSDSEEVISSTLR